MTDRRAAVVAFALATAGLVLTALSGLLGLGLLASSLAIVLSVSGVALPAQRLRQQTPRRRRVAPRPLSTEEFERRCAALLQPPDPEPEPDLPDPLPMSLRHSTFQHLTRPPVIVDRDGDQWCETRTDHWHQCAESGANTVAYVCRQRSRCERGEAWYRANIEFCFGPIAFLTNEPAEMRGATIVVRRAFRAVTHCPLGHIGAHWVGDGDPTDGTVERTCVYSRCARTWREGNGPNA